MPRDPAVSAAQQDHADGGPRGSSWASSRDVPRASGSGRFVVHLRSLSGLSLVRRQVRSFMSPGCGAVTAAACEDFVERAVLVIDELTSNALRHGTPPSALEVTDEPGRWLVVVSDAAPGQQPIPAVGRPAEHGGHGLHVIADLTVEHGVQYGDDHKLVWASLPKPPGAPGMPAA